MSRDTGSSTSGRMGGGRVAVGALLAGALFGGAAAAALTGCGVPSAAPDHHEAPAALATIPGSNVKRITLTASAVQRLDLQTAPVRRNEDGTLAVPYGAVVYAPDGQAWAYTNPEGHVYIRERLEILEIVGDTEALLASGPAEGTLVVAVGTAELWGTETGVGGGH